ncbi:uncharacterized protein N0V89_011499 [Didymosphaeria variabile]|uniref:Yeast cell wall synthesis Kre9/Knh1-like N-terminal domain-containing protein n=1 Tax=Didymosphaeria variabile TaxID=1932322 RepID=A0A9W8XAB2_9PLEO|nr:uncharacterized protein N0V89_011499 [Didymosphaeria variabile]KAJ4345369.1 hypothetical protein N0V89_011499 [Didymosphaeria variabile]
MRFFEVVLSGAALISAALAVEFNSWPDSVTAGETVTLTYSPKDAATTIILRKGPSTDLTTLSTLTTTSTGGSFEWAVPSSLENGDDYAFEIQQAGAEPNYSGQFSLSGGVASAVSSSAYSTAESSSASASASSSASKTPASSSAYATGVSTTVKTSVVTSAASASASIIPSHGANSTISTGSPSATKSESSGSATGIVPPVENTGAASSFGVNAAALFGAIGAFAYLA